MSTWPGGGDRAALLFRPLVGKDAGGAPDQPLLPDPGGGGRRRPSAGYVGLLAVVDEGYITNVAVRPDCRRQGVASSLLQALEARGRARNLTFLTLEVRQSNAPARALYEMQGYVQAGMRRNYYENPREDAVIMTKTL